MAVTVVLVVVAGVGLVVGRQECFSAKIIIIIILIIIIMTMITTRIMI